ncbi:hypothetical protein EsH8_I_001327 [Colletotrichum jinshuiense]
MQYSNVLVLGLTSLLASVPVINAAECTVGAMGLRGAGWTVQNCCWGGRDNFQACMNQNADEAFCEAAAPNWCGRNGITPEQCDADCCDTTTGWGMGCPK